MGSKIILNSAIAPNEWIRIDHDIEDKIPEGNILLPLAAWQKHYVTLKIRARMPGLWIRGDENPSDFPGDIKTIPVIAIYFPAFTDGRGFSLGNLLRDRYRYEGELRACGHIIRDQLFYLRRCGFNSFEFDNATNLEEAMKSLKDFSESYQLAADQGTPLFRRRK
jgi:uncharacterized protein (DUF934 family)